MTNDKQGESMEEPRDDAAEESQSAAETPEDAPEGLVPDEGGIDDAMDADPAEAHLADFPAFDDGGEFGEEDKIDLLMDVDLEVKIELGRAQMLIEDVLKLKKGAVVELDKLAGDPVDILVNERAVARGEVLVVNDNFCVRVTEILDPEAGLVADDSTD